MAPLYIPYSYMCGASGGNIGCSGLSQRALVEAGSLTPASWCTHISAGHFMCPGLAHRTFVETGPLTPAVVQANINIGMLDYRGVVVVA